MKRMISFLLPFLMAGGVYAQQEEPLIGGGEQQQQMAQEFQGIPLVEGAQKGDQPGHFTVQKPLEDVARDYKQQLESEGYTVNEISSEEGKKVWDIQKGETRANVTLDETPDGSGILIEPQGGLMK